MDYAFNIFSKASEFEAFVNAVEKFRQEHGLYTPQGRQTELFRVGFAIKAKCGRRAAKFCFARDCKTRAEAEKIVNAVMNFAAGKIYHVSVVSEFDDLCYMRGYKGDELGIMLADFSKACKAC